MPIPRRDLEQTREQLLGWFASKLPDAEALRIPELSGPSDTGFSNDTLLFDLVWNEAGRERSEGLVVRIEPTGFKIFPRYDIAQQYRVMRLLEPTGVPVPRMRWLEEDPEILGAPFYVMERVEGRVPTDNPPYHMAGWVTEIRPEERTKLWWSGLEVLARIHRVDWRGQGLELLDAPQWGSDPLEQQLRYYEDYLRWAALPHATTVAPPTTSPMVTRCSIARIWTMTTTGFRMIRTAAL